MRAREAVNVLDAAVPTPGSLLRRLRKFNEGSRARGMSSKAKEAWLYTWVGLAEVALTYAWGKTAYELMFN